MEVEAHTVDAAPLTRARRMIGHLAAGALDFVLPPQCASCRERTAKGVGLCATCWSRLEFIESPLCPVSGRPFVYDPGPGILSAAALARPSEIARLRAAVRYGDVSRRMVHALKYSDRLELVQLVARLMVRAAVPLLGEADLMMPVPLHPRRLWRRRYNQSALLARELHRLGACPAPATDVLVRVRATPAQVGLSREERRRNVRNAFALAPSAREVVAGRRVLVVDDVVTTGATLEACARALRDAGAREVDGLAFAMICDPVAPAA